MRFALDFFLSTCNTPVSMAATVKASWNKLAQQELLKCCSHSLAVVDQHAIVFGGELLRRQPRHGEVHAIALTGKSTKRSAFAHEQ